MKTSAAAISGSLALLFFQNSAWGVVIATPDPGNLPTSPPANGAPWANVLNTNFSSGVYIGGGWVITAKHVYDTHANPFVTHNSITYLADSSKSYVLDNPLMVGLSAKADLVLFRLQSHIPSLPTIPLGASSANLPITMIGFGGGKSWGGNNVDPSGLVSVDLAPFNDIVAFFSDYDTATLSEGQGVAGDSGGGAFAFQDDSWKLVGIMNAVDTASDPDRTYFSDISTYSSQITGIILAQGSIPEPSSILLTSPALLLLLRRRRCETRH